MYLQLSEAMDCLEHICTEGCTTVGPHHVEPTKNKAPCSTFSTCQGLQLLIKHFAQCKKRVNGGCLRCKRMWQLLQLHSSICDKIDDCQVPLCRQFKLKVQQGKQRGDSQWKLLVEKVLAARAKSALLQQKKPQPK
uniref:TAZ-type domain-containing protein n=1 Tax=Kalanchoe fedtschenkoi TaxID=63787 RepID=A0A7N0VC28_KALFE